MNTQWIKTADRAPTEADLPVWLQLDKGSAFFHESVNGVTLMEAPRMLIFVTAGSIAWRPAKADIPEPPREETQRDNDCKAYTKWFLNNPAYAEAAWHAALAYERAEVAKMLPPPLSKNTLTVRETYNAIEAIRARCEGRGK